ncbi:phage holin family protein [Shimia biformata]|uniref:phage holin family protein n=1 Tax=Shimia biformata TaxID=1294299 RepID=UPI00195093D2|nr:phage holin family protein [Shimia biformata]
MVRFLYSVAAYLVANAVGLLIAAILLPGFSIGFMAFVVAVLIFSVVQGVLGPVITKISMKKMPQLMGGISLVTIFIGLWLTSLIVSGMQIGGISNWLAATLLVWLGSLVAGILLPIYVFKSLREGAAK